MPNGQGLAKQISYQNCVFKWIDILQGCRIIDFSLLEIRFR